MGIRVAESDDEIRACYPVMRQLRPHFTLDAFLERVRFQQERGYCLVFLEVDGAPVAVADRAPDPSQEEPLPRCRRDVGKR